MSVQPSHRAANLTRDPRIDFFRGVALLVIFTNHMGSLLDSKFLGFISWRSLGMSDAAELFLFMSGLVYGMAYDRACELHGALACIGKSFRRLLDLYFANLGMLLFLMLVVWIGSSAFSIDSDFNAVFLNAPMQVIFDLLMLNKVPKFFDILPLYMILLVTMPFLLLLFRRAPWAALGLSIVLYATSFFFQMPLINGHGFGFQLHFNPLAWQVVFVLGMACGLRRNRGAPPIRLHRGVLSFCISYLVALALVKWAHYLIRNDVGIFDPYDQIGDWIGRVFDKRRLMPLRLAHFLALAYVVVCLLPSHAAFWTGRLAQRIREVGQHSLKMFCLGVILTYLGAYFATSLRPSLLLDLSVTVFGWAIMFGFAGVLAQSRSQSRLSSQPSQNIDGRSGGMALD